MKKGIIFLFVIFLCIFSGRADTAEITEEETTQKDLGKGQPVAYKKDEQTKQTKKYQLKYFISAIQGYDNNVFLDSRRKADTFSEAILDAKLIYPITGRWDLLGEINVNDITYWEATDASLVDSDFKFGFEGKFFGTTTLTVLNDVEVVEYPSNSDGSYIGDKVGITLKRRLPHNFFHTLGYEIAYRNFSDRKARNGWGGKSDDDREDTRNTFSSEFGVYLKKAMIKLSSDYLINDSNDTFMDYYRYDAYKLGTSLTYLVTDKMTAFFSYARQRKQFIARTIPDNSLKRENDRAYVAVAGLFYEIYKKTSLGATYSYRQNKSNDSAQKYSGSITTLGLYCRF